MRFFACSWDGSRLIPLRKYLDKNKAVGQQLNIKTVVDQFEEDLKNSNAADMKAASTNQKRITNTYLKHLRSRKKMATK